MFLNKVKNFFLFSILILFFSIKVNSQEKKIEGLAIIIDGDTIKISNQKIRLFGIDAPEINQKCKKPFISFSFLTLNKEYDCGVVSTNKLKKKIFNKKISCLVTNKDRYGRFIGECFYKNMSINGWMVENGYAVAYLKYSKKFLMLENLAKNKKKGLWQGKFEKPWNWRKRLK